MLMTGSTASTTPKPLACGSLALSPRTPTITTRQTARSHACLIRSRPLELKRYAALLRRSWWVVALVVVVAMASAYGISKAMTPMFRATVTLGAGASVSASGNASQYISLSQGLLNQYARELGSRTLAQKVSDALQLDYAA